MIASPDILTDLEQSWRALNLMFKLASFLPTSDVDNTNNLNKLLNQLAINIADQTSADSVLIVLSDGDNKEIVRYPSFEGNRNDIDISALEEICRPKHLRIPIHINEKMLGTIELKNLQNNKEFRTTHKKLITTIAGYLSLLADRQSLIDYSNTLAMKRSALLNQTIREQRLHSMLLNLLTITPIKQKTISTQCEKVLNNIYHAIPCSGALLSIWDSNDEILYANSEGLDNVALNNMEKYIEKHWKDLFTHDDVSIIGFRRRNQDIDIYPIRMMIAVPLRRLNMFKGLLTLYRSVDESEFNTVDKQGLKLVAGLLSFCESYYE